MLHHVSLPMHKKRRMLYDEDMSSLKWQSQMIRGMLDPGASGMCGCCWT